MQDSPVTAAEAKICQGCDTPQTLQSQDCKRSSYEKTIREAFAHKRVDIFCIYVKTATHKHKVTALSYTAKMH